MRPHVLANIAQQLVLLFILSFASAAFGQTVDRGPYLQQGTDASVIVKWRTSTATDSVVRYGLDSATLTQTVVISDSTTEHEVLISGLASSTEYFYSVGTSSATLAGDASYSFRTSPLPGSNEFMRIWVVGDSGTANSNARAVRDAYKNAYNGTDRANMMIMLGDNAYNTGTEAEYQAAMFDTYPEILRQTPVWSTLGNHDGSTSVPAGESLPYYNIFSLPAQGESGGVPSGTEAYYSYDYANIHFVVLDSYQTNRSSSGAMLTWLGNDLAANDKQWLVAFWHHPPYTKGSHNSDTEGNLIDMRTNALPILEQNGVDLVLSGHSHSYERSFLIDGHYGISDSFTAANQVDAGSGRPSGDGAYSKPDSVSTPNAGSVYAVAGSSGKISGGLLDHEAMYISINQLGSMVVDVNGNQLNAEFLNSSGQVTDWFTINKGVVIDTDPPTVLSGNVVNPNLTRVEFSEVLDPASANNAANYSVDSGVNIVSASLSANGKIVSIATSALSPDISYTLTVNSVTDLAGNPVPANTTLNISYSQIQTRDYQDGALPNSDYLSTQDSYLNSSLPTANFGSAAQLFIDGEDVGADLVSIMRWDISDIPAGSTVTGAAIELGVFNPSNSNYEVYALLRDWDENLVSWNLASPTSWEVAGAQGALDRNPTPLGIVQATATGSYSLSLNSLGIQVVQNWVNGTTTNNGILISNLSSTDGVDMYSRETSASGNRPKLSVTFESSVASNTAPTVDAGSDLTISLPATASLNASVSDDGLPNPPATVSSVWTAESGPGSVSFNDANATDTTASFSIEGTYVLRLTVNDGELGAHSDVQITVLPALAPPPVPSNLNAALINQNDIVLDWIDPASTPENNETAYQILRQIDGGPYLTVASISADSNSYLDAGLSAGFYSYQVQATNGQGSSSSNTTSSIEVDETSTTVIRVASSESTAQGSILSGSFVDTTQMVGSETLREQHQGGKPKNRVSQLDHSWIITSVPAGSVLSIDLQAQAPSNSEGDNFTFEYSVNGGSYVSIGSVVQGSGNQSLAAMLPSATSGTVSVRVRDTNRTTGNSNLDTITISYLAVTSITSTGGNTAPVVSITSPSDSANFEIGTSVSFSGSANDAEDGNLTANLTWTSSIDGQIGSGSGFTSSALSLGSHTITASVEDSESISSFDSISIDITNPPSAIALTVAANKTKGKHTPLLSWTGASSGNVDIYRDAALLVNTGNSGSYQDNTGNKGGRTYVYQVCEAGSMVCSDQVAVVY